LSLFQNPLVFPQAPGTSGLKPVCSLKSKVVVPKLMFWNSRIKKNFEKTLFFPNSESFFPFGCIPFSFERRHLGYLQSPRRAARVEYETGKNNLKKALVHENAGIEQSPAFFLGALRSPPRSLPFAAASYSTMYKPWNGRSRELRKKEHTTLLCNGGKLYKKSYKLYRAGFGSFCRFRLMLAFFPPA
jgi:hypothetical protein